MTSQLHAAVARELIAERHRQAADARRHPASTKTNRWPGPPRRRLSKTGFHGEWGCRFLLFVSQLVLSP